MFSAIKPPEKKWICVPHIQGISNEITLIKIQFSWLKNNFQLVFLCFFYGKDFFLTSLSFNCSCWKLDLRRFLFNLSAGSLPCPQAPLCPQRASQWGVLSQRAWERSWRCTNVSVSPYKKRYGCSVVKIEQKTNFSSFNYKPLYFLRRKQHLG